MNLIKYLPFENYTLETRLSTADVLARLEANVKASKGFRNSAPAKPYKGKITGDSFEISRIIFYGNSFLPVIKGHIHTHLGKTRITIKMRMLIFVTIFMSFWLGLVGLLCLGLLLMGLLHLSEILQHGFSPGALIPFVMFLLGSLTTSFGFKRESKKAKIFLSNLLQGQEVEIAS